jgi:hypothetical protein
MVRLSSCWIARLFQAAKAELATLVAGYRDKTTCLKRSSFNLRYQLKAERVQALSGGLHFAKICGSGFSRNA